MSDIIKSTEKFVISLLSKELNEKFLFHNLRRTQTVVKSTMELLEFYMLPDKERETIILAAWLQDIGYTYGTDKHEQSSSELATKFLREQSYEEEDIKKVCGLIRATKPGHEPSNLSEEILRDADASFLGHKNYLKARVLRREEQSLLGISNYSQEEWYATNIKMFGKGHRFYTDYALANWQAGKDDNLVKLVKNKEKNKKLLEKENLKTRFKQESPERGIQTMFRVTMANHLKLSAIADTKANILLSVNAIIISLVLSNLIPKLDNPSNAYLIYPTVIFVIFSIISMVLSILATRPKITTGKFTQADVMDKKVNILFFGNFHKMKQPEYEDAFQSLIKDKEYMYSTMSKDLYFLGKVLFRKYKILQWTYTTFMIGMILSVIAFAFAFRYYGS